MEAQPHPCAVELDAILVACGAVLVGEPLNQGQPERRELLSSPPDMPGAAAQLGALPPGSLPAGRARAASHVGEQEDCLGSGQAGLNDRGCRRIRETAVHSALCQAGSVWSLEVRSQSSIWGKGDPESAWPSAPAPRRMALHAAIACVCMRVLSPRVPWSRRESACRAPLSPW